MLPLFRFFVRCYRIYSLSTQVKVCLKTLLDLQMESKAVDVGGHFGFENKLVELNYVKTYLSKLMPKYKIIGLVREI